VLTVYWSAENFPSTAVIDASIRRALVFDSSVLVDNFAEYLESDLFPPDDASEALRAYIRHKYSGRHIDVVIAVSDPALQFVLKQRAELFPDAAIVSSSINAPPDSTTRTAGAGVTGVVGGDAYDQTLDLALRLHPSTKRVFVVAEAPTLPLADMVREQLRAFSTRVELSYIEERSLDRLLAAIRAIPAGSLVLYVRQSQEDQGNVLFPSDVARLVSDASPVPVYGVSDSYIGSGVVGGVVASREDLGARLGQMSRQILAGTRAQDIPIEPVRLIPAFDWRELKRWGIDSSRVPPGSEIRFQQPNLWEAYRGYVAAAIVIVLVQFALISALLVQNTRRRQIESALREEARFRSAADTAPVMIWRSGVDKKCDFFNLQWLAFTGRTLAEEVGDGWAEGVHADDIAACMATYRAAFDACETFRMEYRLRRFDGEYRWVLDTGVPRFEPDGVFAGYIGSCIDISDRRQAEVALQEAHVELSRVSRLTALGEFAASLAHEVRQPLTAIIMNARSCLRGIAGEKPDLEDVRAALLDIVDAGQRAEEVIQRNREMFRLHRVQSLALDINDVIRAAIVLANGRLKESHVTIVTALADDLPTVSGDRIELQQVLLNLIANGIDATEPVEVGRRRIQISSSLTSDVGVRVAVSDNGIGLANVDRQRMFTLSYTTKPTGTGVGLSISRSIIEAHGGKLSADQNPDGGATFSFSLPICATDSHTIQRSPEDFVTGIH